MKELILKAKTEITANNLPDFAKELRAVLKSVNTDLKTDEDFAEAKTLVKKFDESEKALKAAKERIFESGGLAEINTLINELSAECRDVRLTLNRTVTAKEKEVKQGLIDTARDTLITASKNSVMYSYLTVDWSDIAEQIKGKKLLSKMEEALNTYVGVKINAIQVEETSLLTKLKLIESLIKDNENLFNLESLMRDDNFEETIKERIQVHDEQVREQAKAEAARLVEQERQANAKAKADRLAQEASDQVNQEVPEQIKPSTPIAKDVHPETTQRTFAQGQSVQQYRIRLDVNCTLDEAKSIATELKNDYQRLGAIVSLNRVNQEQAA